jgi:hypothetical protein
MTTSSSIPFIRVMGLPASGNRVIWNLICRAMLLAHPELAHKGRTENVIWCDVWHGQGDTQVPPAGSLRYYVVPVRCPVCRNKSWRKKGWHVLSEDGMVQGREAYMMRYPGKVRYISYEAFVADPEGVGRYIVEDFLKLPWPGLPQGQSKDPNGEVFDGNEQYRS